MFKDLTNFALKRDLKGAVGFYVAYLFVTFFAVVVVGMVAVRFAATAADGYRAGVRTGSVVAFVICLALSTAICRAKGIAGRFSSIMLILLTGLLAAVGGGVLGMAVPAFLTTHDPAGRAPAPTNGPERDVGEKNEKKTR